MPISVIEITDKQLLEVLSYTEGHFLDLKAKAIKPAKLTKTISAFANADGGEVYVGIAESVTLPFPHKWEGFAKPEEANGHLQIFEKLFPLGEDYSYSFLAHPKQTGIVLQVSVRKTKGIVKANDGTVYIRRGAQCLPVTTQAEITRLEHNKGITSFENEVVPVAFDTAQPCCWHRVPDCESQNYWRSSGTTFTSALARFDQSAPS
jgi:ATP-dependent DNA helicase RecG